MGPRPALFPSLRSGQGGAAAEGPSWSGRQDQEGHTGTQSLPGHEGSLILGRGAVFDHLTLLSPV